LYTTIRHPSLRFRITRLLSLAALAGNVLLAFTLDGN
jgi:hypothetical protein